LLRLERRVTQASVFVACCLFAGAALAGLYQVVARFLLGQPASWSETLVRTLLIWMVYLALAGAVRVGALVSVDLLYRIARGRWRRAMDAMISLAVLGLLAILAWFGTAMAYRVRLQNLAGLEVSISWAYAAVPVGCLIASLAVVAHYFDPARRETENAT
jgi:TRAP-type C4-dicarboxylate transport system permease small subunit